MKFVPTNEFFMFTAKSIADLFQRWPSLHRNYSHRLHWQIKTFRRPRQETFFESCSKRSCCYRSVWTKTKLIQVDSNVFTTFLATDIFKSFILDRHFRKCSKTKANLFSWNLIESQSLNLKDSDFIGETFWHWKWSFDKYQI